MKGLLVRVAIDKTAGAWNAPCRYQSREFTYVPIPESQPVVIQRKFEEVKPAIEKMGVDMPHHLSGLCMHLDPDFEKGTYGDQGRKGVQVNRLEKGDFIAFYAGFNPLDECPHKLVYGLYGIMFVKKIISAENKKHSDLNAHTRRKNIRDDEIVVIADSSRSGRFDRFIPIGEYREGCYRVTNPLLKRWGGLSIKNGFIQRSVNFPRFSDPKRFLDWLGKEKPKLIKNNW